MIKRDWMVSKVAIIYPNTVKFFEQYKIDVGCCYGDGHLTLEQVARKLNISVDELLETIEGLIAHKQASQ